MRVPQGERLKGERFPTPIWLSDADYPAPCPCGDPFMEGDPMVLVEGETGLKIVYHMRCIAPAMIGEEDE
jgi:hypothetical protein